METENLILVSIHWTVNKCSIYWQKRTSQVFSGREFTALVHRKQVTMI